jgi:hypothetical protein
MEADFEVLANILLFRVNLNNNGSVVDYLSFPVFVE